MWVLVNYSDNQDVEIFDVRKPLPEEFRRGVLYDWYATYCSFINSPTAVSLALAFLNGLLKKNAL